MYLWVFSFINKPNFQNIIYFLQLHNKYIMPCFTFDHNYNFIAMAWHEYIFWYFDHSNNFLAHSLFGILQFLEEILDFLDGIVIKFFF